MKERLASIVRRLLVQESHTISDEQSPNFTAAFDLIEAMLIVELEILDGPGGTTSIRMEAVRGWDQANNLPINIAAQSGELTRTLPTAFGKSPPVPGSTPAELL